MKRTIASILVILGFGSYAWVEKTKTENNTPNKIKKDVAVTGNSTTSTSVTSTAAVPKTTVVAPVVKKIQQEIVYSNDEYEEDDRPRVVTSGTPYSVNTQPSAPAVVQSVPTTPTPAPVTVVATQPASSGQYKNGSYIGDSVNVYYGDVQVKATVSGGKLTAVDFLTYPQDRSRSLAIAERAMPVLIQEAISAQSSQVDVVSGATAISTGFIQSLASALSKAQ